MTPNAWFIAAVDFASLNPLVERFALVLMHSLWQALLVVNVVAIALAALARAKPAVRYLVALGGLLMLPLFPIVTWMLVEPTPTPLGAPMVSASDAPLDPLPRLSQLRAVDTLPVAETTVDRCQRVASSVDRFCRRNATGLALAWSLGVVVFAFRLLLAWLSVTRLRRDGGQPVPDCVRDTLDKLAAIIGVRRPVDLRASDRVDGPAVMGWFRPLILLPAHALTGLSTEELSHVLAHELAHVRRGDYAVNLLQCVIEMLFFHHPAVWWLSHQVREEREHCCDEIAIAACGDRFAYARSLATLDDIRPESRPHLFALGTRGGRLMNRIRRLLGVPTPSASGSGALVLGVFASALVVAVFLGSSSATAQTRDPAKSAENPPALPESKADPAATDRAETYDLSQRDAKVKAEFEAMLREAKELEALAREEADLHEQAYRSGQLAIAELIAARKRLGEARLEVLRARHSLGDEADTPASLAISELKQAESMFQQAYAMLTEVEKRVADGVSSKLDLIVAKREVLKSRSECLRLHAKLAETLADPAVRADVRATPLAADPVVTKAYLLKHAQAKAAVARLADWSESDAKPGAEVKVGVDERANTIIVWATPADHVIVAARVKELDQRTTSEFEPKEADDRVRKITRTKESLTVLRVVKLQHADAQALAEVINALMGQDLVTPNADTNGLVVRANEAVHQKIAEAVAKLDRPSGKPTKTAVFDEESGSFREIQPGKQGDVMAAKDRELDAARLAQQRKAELEIKLAELDVKQAEAEFTVAAAKRKRIAELAKSNAIATSEVLEIETELMRAELNLARAKLKLEGARLGVESGAADKPTPKESSPTLGKPASQNEINFLEAKQKFQAMSERQRAAELAAATKYLQDAERQLAEIEKAYAAKAKVSEEELLKARAQVEQGKMLIDKLRRETETPRARW